MYTQPPIAPSISRKPRPVHLTDRSWTSGTWRQRASASVGNTTRESLEVLADVVGVFLPTWAVFKQAEPGSATTWAIVATLSFLAAARAFGLRTASRGLVGVRENEALLKAFALAIGLSALMAQLGGLRPDAWALTLGWTGAAVTTWTLRQILRWGLGFLWRRSGRDRKVLIYGTGAMGERLAERLLANPNLGMRPTGFITETLPGRHRSPSGLPVLGDFTDLEILLAQGGIDVLLIALPRAPRRTILDILAACRRQGVDFRIVPDLFEQTLHRLHLTELAGLPVMEITPFPRQPVQNAFRRLIDIAVAGTFLTALLPLLGLTALLVRIDSPGPALFRQWRVGRDRRPFRIVKFRTMGANVPRHAEKPGEATDPRITRLGRWLRRTSIDELPQLWNVLLGDMTLVGPRPEMPFKVRLYGEVERVRLLVKPGITGLWQISPHRGADITSHIDYDIFYIRNRSLWMDLAILLQTPLAIVRGQGAR